MPADGPKKLKPAAALPARPDEEGHLRPRLHVLAAQGSGCNLISHAITQLPYTLVAAAVAFVGFIIVA